MTEIDFTCLSVFEKAQYIWAEGQFIGGITVDMNQILLYAVPEFYVEVYYSTIEKKITDIQLLNDEKLLGLYIEKINIDDLFLR